MSILTDIDRGVDEIITDGALAVVKALADPTGIFMVNLAAASLAGWAAVAAFRGSFSLDGFLAFITRFALFYSLVTAGPLWTKIVYPFIRDFGPGVGNAIVREFGGGDTTGVVSSLNKFILNALKAVNVSIESIGTWDVWTGNAVRIFLMCGIALIVILTLAAIALTWIIISKMLLAILIAIMPVLAVWAYLKSTAEVFNGWVRGVTMLILFQVLTYGVLGTVLAVSDKTGVGISESGASGFEVLGSLAGFIVLSIIGGLCLFACPMIAQRIGGAAISLGDATIRDSLTKGAGMAAQGINNLLSGNRQDPIGNAGNERQKTADTEAGEGNGTDRGRAPLSEEDRESVRKTVERISKM